MAATERQDSERQNQIILRLSVTSAAPERVLPLMQAEDHNIFIYFLFCFVKKIRINLGLIYGWNSM